jgi:hypothetical protein
MKHDLVKWFDSELLDDEGFIKIYFCYSHNRYYGSNFQPDLNNQSRVGKGISAQASHGTVHEALTSYGSCKQI